MTKCGLLWLHLGLSFSFVLGVSCKPAQNGSTSVPNPQAGAIDASVQNKSDDSTDVAAKNEAVNPTSKQGTPKKGLGVPAPVAGNPATNSSTAVAPTENTGFSNFLTNGGGLTSLFSQFFGNAGGLGALGGSGGLSGLSGLTNLFGGGAQNFTGSQYNTQTASAPVTPQSVDDLRKACLDAINQYRSSIGRSALTLRADAGACLDKQSADDGAAGRAHQNFGKCSESAQDECPGWGGDPGTAQAGCLKMMWAEGPGGGHYENMANSGYRQVACGYAQVGAKWWMIQNFYR